MKLEHTPGPWKNADYSRKFNGDYPVYEIVTDDGDCIVPVVDSEPNARLIAAAPDMLEELIEFCKYNCKDCRMRCGDRCSLHKSKLIIESATGKKIEEVLS